MARSSCKLHWDSELITKGSHYLFIIRSSSSSLSLSFSFSLSFLLRFLYFCLIECLLQRFRRLLLHRLRLKRKTNRTWAQVKWKKEDNIKYQHRKLPQESVSTAEQNYIMRSEPHCPLAFPLNQFLLGPSSRGQSLPARACSLAVSVSIATRRYHTYPTERYLLWLQNWIKREKQTHSTGFLSLQVYLSLQECFGSSMFSSCSSFLLLKYTTASWMKQKLQQ